MNLYGEFFKQFDKPNNRNPQQIILDEEENLTKAPSEDNFIRVIQIKVLYAQKRKKKRRNRAEDSQPINKSGSFSKH